MSVKRNRNPNMIEQEKQTLLDLVEAHFTIIESRRTDAVTVAQKNRQWSKLAAEFNSGCTFHSRTVDNLRGCWENMKKVAKKVFADIKTDSATGGGPAKHRKVDPLIYRVRELIKPAVDGEFNPFDSDAGYPLSLDLDEIVPVATNEEPSESRSPLTTVDQSTTVHPTPLEPEIIVIQHVSNADDISSDSAGNEILDNGNWSQYTPSMLRTPVCEVLRPERVAPDPGHSSSPTIPRTGHSRRRPNAPAASKKSTSLEDVHKAKVASLELLMEQSREQHRWFVTIAEEKVKQEKLKTQLLEMEVKQHAKNN